MKTFTLLFLLFLTFTLSSQDIDLANFTYLKSEGNIPEDFLNSSYSKYRDEVNNSELDKKLFIRNAKKQFILKSTFLIDDLLHSGSVFYNDPISEYINKVADVLLKSEPELREEIRFYVTKSTAVNAFSTDKGMIFINIGLIAQLSNEAELAYILAHEIVHYAEKHNMEMYVKKEIIKRGKSDYKILSSDEKFLATNFWSKEIESQADEDALTKYYSTTDYSYKAIIGVFDVLQYSYLPFDEIAFNFSMLESPYFKIPEEYFIKEINPILADENYDDSKSTHPNTMKRRASVLNWIENMKENKNLNFILAEKEFVNVRDLARFETIRQQVINGDYADAIYNCNILLKKYPENFFLKKSIASCLYSCAKYKNNGDINDVVSNPDDIEGQSHQVYYFLREIKDKELNVLALRYIWKLQNQYPKDSYLSSIFIDLFNDLCAFHRYSSLDFSFKPKAESINDLNNQKKEIDTTKLTKYDRIKLQKKEKEIDETEWLRYAFVDALADTSFSNKLKYYSEHAKKRIPDLSPGSNSDDDENDLRSDELLTNKEAIKLAEKQERKEKLFGKALGIKKIIVIDPVYIVVDYRDNENKYIAGEARLYELQNAMQKCAQIADLDLVLLDSKNLTSEDNDKMNDIAVFQDWFSERLMNSEQTIYGSTSKEISDIANQYDADYVAWIAVVNEQYAKDNTDLVYLALCTIATYGGILPFALYYYLKPDITTYYYFLLFDVKTGKSALLEKSAINMNDSKPLIENLVYKSFIQISKSR